MILLLEKIVASRTSDTIVNVAIETTVFGSRRRWTAIGTALITTLLLTTPAAGQSAADREAARTLAAEAKDAFDAKDFEKARDLYHRASELMAAPTLWV